MSQAVPSQGTPSEGPGSAGSSDVKPKGGEGVGSPITYLPVEAGVGSPSSTSNSASLVGPKITQDSATADTINNQSEDDDFSIDMNLQESEGPLPSAAVHSEGVALQTTVPSGDGVETVLEGLTIRGAVGSGAEDIAMTEQDPEGMDSPPSNWKGKGKLVEIPAINSRKRAWDEDKQIDDADEDTDFAAVYQEKRHRSDFQPDMTEEEALAIAVGRSRADAIKRLQKATAWATGVALTLKTAEMERKSNPPPVNESVLAVLEPTAVKFRDCPKAISTPCIIKRGMLQKEYGGLKKQKGPFDFRMRMDFGRYGRPSLSLTMRRSRNISKPLEPEKPESFHEVRFTWQPGCSTGSERGFYTDEDGHQVHHVHQRWELEDLWMGAFIADDEAILIERKLWYPWKDSEIYQLSESEREKLIYLNFTARFTPIESSVNEGSIQQDVRDPEFLALLDDLFSEEETQLGVLFLIPEADANNPRQISRNVFGFMAIEYEWFKTAYNQRWQPDYPYLDEEGQLNIDLDMRDIKTFKNRMYVTYPKEVVRLQEAERETTGQITYWPEPAGFYTHPMQYYYHSVTAYCIPLMVGVVRSWQWEMGQHQLLSSHYLQAAVVKSLRLDNQDQGKATGAQDTRLRTFFVFVWLPNDQRLRVPAEQSAWHLEFAEQRWGQEVHQAKKVRWIGFVKPMTQRELQATGASFVMACTKPRGAQWIQTANDCTELADKHYHQLRMTQIVDKGSAQRVLACLREFADMGRDDLHSFQLTFAFDKEVAQRPNLPLNHGNYRSEDGMMSVCLDLWNRAVSLLTPQLDQGQADLLSEGFQKIFNHSKIVLGGPGCKKTTTLALAAVIMGVVDHKIMLLAEDNAAVNNFHKKLDVAQELMWQLATKAGDKELAVAVAGQSYLRFIQPAIEKDALLRGEVENEDGLHQSGKQRAPDFWLEMEDAIALIEAEAAISKDLEDVSSLDQVQLQMKLAERSQIAHDWERIKAEYERLPESAGRNNEFPVRHSFAFAIRSMERSRANGELDRSASRYLEAFENARMALLGGEGDRRTLAKDFTDATNTIVAHVVQASTVVGATYVSSAHHLMRENFEASVVVHEEASRAKLSTVKCGLVYENVRAHIFIGDVQQLKPFDSASHVNEFKHISKESVLHYLIQKGHGYAWVKTNYRNHPDILKFPNAQWYENLLESAPNVFNVVPEHGIWTDIFQEVYQTEVQSQYYFVNVPRGISQVREGGTSLQNYASAKVIATLCKALIDKGMRPAGITVAVWYRGQLDVISYYFQQLGVEGVILVTVDSYLGEDNDFVFLDLTATTQEGLPAISGEGPLWQEATTHLTSENRLCTALTRARYGCALVGGAASLQKALDKSGKGTGLKACITDAIDRDIMVTDMTEDESDYFQRVFKQSPRYGDFRKETALTSQFGWMAQYRQRNFGNKTPAKVSRGFGRPSSARVTYAGKDQASKFSGFGPQVKDLTKRRQAAPDAIPPTDKQNVGSKKKRKGRKSNHADAADGES